ncbi:MAG: InlB B-repeat-containing protein [Lachnospiraceae bacterium]|nr:InlB B-repeat-containing protein [Lachnospiraceae bacterium]
MKNIVYGVVIILLGIVIALTIITVTGTMNREVEIEDSLQIAVEKSVDACTTKHNYSLDNTDQFVADLMVELSNAIENDSALDIQIMGIDKDKGMLSVRVVEYYTTAIGVPKTATCESTAIFDRGDANNIKSGITITFVDDDGSYLGEQTVDATKEIKAIITPAKEGKTFNGWLNTKTNKNVGINLGKAGEDITFKATYILV